MQKEKAILYALDKELCPVIRHRDLLTEYEVVAAVSPADWGFCGQDVSVIDGGEPTGIFIEEDYQRALERCETVIFCDCRYYKQIEKHFYLRMKEALERGKNIVSLAEMDKACRAGLTRLAGIKQNYMKFKNHITINSNPWLDHYRTFKMNEWEYKNKPHVFEELRKIEVPVIFVAGMTEESNKFELQLALRTALIQAGYKVGQIGSRPYCELLGFHSFPLFMSDKRYSEVEKILMFNYLLAEIGIREEPDFLIVGIPGGMVMASNLRANKFGIYAYEISQAATPDYVYMNVLLDDFIDDFPAQANLTASYRFGFEIDCFGLSGHPTHPEGRLSADKDMTVQTGQIPAYHILNPVHIQHMVQRMADRLGHKTGKSK